MGATTQPLRLASAFLRLRRRAMSAAATLGRALARAVPSAKAAPQSLANVTARGFGTYTKSASPQTPLMHYTATQQATSSINHRIFYVNVTAMVLVYDLGSSMLDL